METTFEWVTIVVGWLVILVGAVAVVAGLLYLLDVLIYQIIKETEALTILGDFVKNRKNFRFYKRDREAWEEEQRKARDKWNVYIQKRLKGGNG